MERIHLKSPHVAAVAPAKPRVGQRFVRPGAQSKRRSPLSWVAFAMFVAQISLFIPPDLLHPTGVSAADYGAPSATSRAIKFALIGISLAIMFSHARLSRALLQAVNRPFIIMLVLIPLSIAWSIDSGATIARFVSLFTVVISCFAICLVDWHRRRFQEVVLPVITVFLVASLVIGLISPELVLEEDILLKGSWHGLCSQKNEFGQIASFGVILWMHAWLSREVKWVYALMGLAVAATCLGLSKSSTALLATFFAVPMLLLLQRQPPALRPYLPYMVGIFAGLCVLYAVAILNLVPGLGLLLKPFLLLTGKDFTFSNRVIIWEIVREHIALAPILGTGYGAYWVGPVPTSPSFVFLARMWMYPTQSHNGFLEITNDLGFVGLTVLMCYVVVYIRQSLSVFKFDRTEGALFIAIMFQQIIVNLQEAVWITPKVSSSVMTMFATVAVGRMLLERQRQLQGRPKQPRKAVGGT